jgi:single-stranded DNA-binding protein
MLASVNRIVLVGEVGRNGVEMRYTPSGAGIASFLLCLTELGTDGKPHTTMVPCQVVGRKAEGVSTIPGGTMVAFEGRIDKRRVGERYEMLCTGFDLQALSAVQPAAATVADDDIPF